MIAPNEKRQALLACEMMKDEVNRALAVTGFSGAIYWLEKGWHEHPEKLHGALQAQIDDVQADLLLLAFGLCGNALDGIVTPDKMLVVPRFHDCIHMLLVSEEGDRRETLADSLYYTGAWLDSDFTLLNQYERFSEQKGTKKAKRAFSSMLQHYRSLHMIDTGESFLPEHKVRAEQTAAAFELDYHETTGSNQVLVRLLRGEWDNDFLVYEPGQMVAQRDFLGN